MLLNVAKLLPNVAELLHKGIVALSDVEYLFPFQVQWDLFIKHTLGPANLSTVERLSTLLR